MFASGTTEYTARVGANAVGFVTVTATPTDAPGATVEIMPADRNSLFRRDLGAEVHQVYLTAGNAHTTITVTVTAEDGSTNTYTFMVYRERATASPMLLCRR